MTQFLDYLSLSQNRIPGSVPVVASQKRIGYDLHSGEVITESYLPECQPGSYDSSLFIKSDATRVSLCGNPSAFNRPDNLFGLRCVAHALEVINPVMSSVDLPAFDSCRANETANRQAAHSDGALLQDERARISRVDVTENLATNDAMAAIRHLSAYRHHGIPGYLYPNGYTVEWGGKAFSGKGSRRIYHKYYIKAEDIREKISNLKKRINSKQRDIIEYHIDYLLRLAAFCDEHQIVRRETSFKSTELIDRDLIYLERWNIPMMNNINRPYQFHKKLNISETRLSSVAEHLENAGYSSAVAAKAEMIHAAWIQGGDLKKLCVSKRTYYRYRNILLGVGVDIFNPCNISQLTYKEHRTSFNSVKPPSWYELPESYHPQLKLVA